MCNPFLRARILDSVVFKRDIEVGRQEGHQLHTELDLRRNKHKDIKRMTVQEAKGRLNPRVSLLLFIIFTCSILWPGVSRFTAVMLTIRDSQW